MHPTNAHRAVVLDIEGTTTPVAFVYETLFPYARAALADFLEARWEDPEVQRDVAAIAEQAARDAQAGVEGVPTVRDDVDEAAKRADVLANLIWQMDHDRKTTGLKSLQGKIWRAGYQDGRIHGQVFEDVPHALEQWKAQQVPVYIYSSGSVEAQQLLFAYSTHGDLTPLISGYFDTTTGPKKQAQSYRIIAEAIDVPADEVVFATDNLDEARAADEAGWQVVLLDRPGNAPVEEHDFAVLKELETLAGGDVASD